MNREEKLWERRSKALAAIGRCSANIQINTDRLDDDQWEAIEDMVDRLENVAEQFKGAADECLRFKD